MAQDRGDFVVFEKQKGQWGWNSVNEEGIVEKYLREVGRARPCRVF